MAKLINIILYHTRRLIRTNFISKRSLKCYIVPKFWHLTEKFKLFCHYSLPEKNLYDPTYSNKQLLLKPESFGLHKQYHLKFLNKQCHHNPHTTSHKTLTQVFTHLSSQYWDILRIFTSQREISQVHEAKDNVHL